MSKGYLFVGGPAHGQERAVEHPDAPVLVAELSSPPFVSAEPSPTEAVSLDITTYVMQKAYRVVGPYGFYRGVFAPQEWPLWEVEARLRDLLFERWVSASPDQVEEVPYGGVRGRSPAGSY